MPPSAGACQTTDAWLNPDWGRPAAWSSTSTAIGCRAASAGARRRPVSGATARTGVGTGGGAGVGTGAGVGFGGTVAGIAEPVRPNAAALADGAGEVDEPHAATAPATATTSRIGRRRSRPPGERGIGRDLMPGGEYPGRGRLGAAKPRTVWPAPRQAVAPASNPRGGNPMSDQSIPDPITATPATGSLDV